MSARPLPVRRTSLVVGLIALLLLGVTTLAPAAGAAVPAPSAGPSAARAGDLIEVRMRDLHPTQPEIGYDQIHYKLGRYASSKDTDRGKLNARFDDWCETNGQGEAATAAPTATLRDPSTFTCTVAVGAETPATLAEMKTVVVGPGGALYLTDGHHTMTSFLETPDGGPDMRIRVRVDANFATLTPDAFWQQMRAHNWVWLTTSDGRQIRPEDLPRGIGLARLGDDPYRGLVYFTRDIGYTAPDNAPEFLEFFWAQWLRPQVPAWNRDDPAAYLATVEKASRLMSATPGTTEIAPGRTADALGRLAAWNGGKKATGGTFGDLSAPITAAKPGKIAYAISSRAKVPASPACTRTLTGVVNAPVISNGGVLCLANAQVRGPVVVGPGGSLVSHGADVLGPVTTTGARVVEICGTGVIGPTTVVRTTERTRIGGYACTPNDLRGPVIGATTG